MAIAAAHESILKVRYLLLVKSLIDMLDIIDHLVIRPA